MSKYSNKKALISILVVMVMVLSAFVVIASPVSASAYGTVTYNPTTYGVNPSTNLPLTTVAFVSGGTFSSGATIYFYLSTSDSYSGIISYDAIGSTVLTATSPTTLNQAVTFFPNGDVITGININGKPIYGSAPTITPGTYYILATNAAPPLIAAELATLSWAFPSSSAQFVPQTASITVYNMQQIPAVGDNALTVGSTALVLGSGWDSGATVNIYLNYPGSSVLLTTTTANSFGNVMATFTVPNLSGTVEMSF
ncbi:MAG: hypothetical protein ACP5MB_11545, partial [bacterium]